MNIIINADDFGISKELNACVSHLHKQGVLSSATLISNSPDFQDAVITAKKLPELGIGVHLTLDGPYNVLKSASSVINPETGQFYNSRIVVGKLRYFGFKSDDIFKEYCAQIGKILDHGVNITHIDHHHHYHLYHKSLDQVKRVAQKFKIRCVRSQVILMPRKTSLVNTLYRKHHQHSMLNGNLVVPDGYFELLPITADPVKYNLDRLKQILSEKYSKIEIETHPDSPRHFDTNFLQHPDFFELINKHSIISYRELIPASKIIK
jgi:chitin disaccharide deacetylase